MERRRFTVSASESALESGEMVSSLRGMLYAGMKVFGAIHLCGGKGCNSGMPRTNATARRESSNAVVVSLQRGAPVGEKRQNYCLHSLPWVSCLSAHSAALEIRNRSLSHQAR